MFSGYFFCYYKINLVRIYEPIIFDLSTAKHMEALTEQQKKELVLFVLDRTPVWFFNIATASFSVQKLYARCKQDLLREYPHLMDGNLQYAIVMCEAFRQYQSDEIGLPETRRKLESMKQTIKFLKKCRPAEYGAKVDEYNTLTDAFNKALNPQNELINLYKQLSKTKV